ncbi:MAG: hypothetical protein ACLRXA_23010 [Clostridium sp.]
MTAMMKRKKPPSVFKYMLSGEVQLKLALGQAFNQCGSGGNRGRHRCWASLNRRMGRISDKVTSVWNSRIMETIGADISVPVRRRLWIPDRGAGSKQKGDSGIWYGIPG